MKKLFALPMLGLVLGAVAIATEIKTNDVLPAPQQTGAMVHCVKTAMSAGWKTYKISHSLFHSGFYFNRNRKAAWSTYKHEIKTCKGNLPLQCLDTDSSDTEQQ